MNAKKAEEKSKSSEPVKSIKPLKEPYDDKAIAMATYELNDLQFKIYNELKLDPITILYHYDEIYDDDKYTFKDKLIIIETMIKILMTSIEKEYISSINLAKEVIAKLRKHIKSFTGVDNANIVENLKVDKEYDT